MRSKRLLIVTLALMLSPLLAPRLLAQQPLDLTTANLEDLLKMEVRSVSKKEQQLFRTPAAVYVLTNEEIRRSGVTTVPDALRLVPGLQVAQIDGNKWAVTSRGFNGLWANKLLVLVDGRAIYSPVSSGVYWDLQDLPLEDLERIEVIRGPGAAIWGANAVNGVINSISKSSRSTQGGLVAATTGNVDRGIATVRYGGALGTRATYRLYAKHSDRGQLVDDNGEPAHDDSRTTQVGGRAEFDASAIDAVTIDGAWLWGESGQRINTPLRSYIPAPSGIISTENPSHVGHVLGRWTRTHSARSSVSLQAFWDKSYRLVVDKGEWTQTFDLEFQHRLPVGRRHDLLWGVGQRFWGDREDVRFAEYLDPPSSHIRLFNAFVQDEIVVTPQLNLTLGSKFEHNSVAGFEVQPTARLTWSPTPRQTGWISFSRAARTPSRIERALHVDFVAIPGPNDLILVPGIRGNPDIQTEQTESYELGYRAEIGSHWMFDVAAFVSQFDDLATAIPGSAFDLTPGPPHLSLFGQYQSVTDGESHGAEFLVRWQPSSIWRLDGSLDLLETHFCGVALQFPDVVARLDRNPEQQWRLKSWLSLPRGWQVDALWSYIGALNSVDVPGYSRFDVRVGASLRRGLDLSVVGHNLLDEHHREFDGFEGVLLSQARRSGAVTLTVSF
jgi:iron complex outermembrane receptor protein